MIRKTLTILSLIGLLLSVGLLMPNRVLLALCSGLWMPTLLFASILGCSYFPLHRRRKRKKLGLCLKCAYDLRASKERCPECGEGFISTPVAR